MGRRELHVGIVGAGMGGLTAAIATARAGARVTILEAAHELGDIGAGIQVYPNVSRLLIRWGVDKIIGDNLVQHDECNTYYGPEGKLVAYADPKEMSRKSGFPWWVVRRDHLHAGLTESAKRHGADIIIDSRVNKMEENGDRVKVTTTSGASYEFDLVLGADGIRSFMRSQLFPDVIPKAPSKVAAYRGVLTYEQVFREVPEARAYLRNTMDLWAGPNGYILMYPISGGRDLNVVTGYVRDDFVTKPEDVDINEFRESYKDFSPFIQKIIKLVAYTQRWPLLQMPRMERWSNEKRNIVLLGDAVHCMQNHMAQGAATAMEDGAFLGQIIGEVVRGVISVQEGVKIYEEKRIPRAWTKQQISFTSGIVNMDIPRTEDRNRASRIEIEAKTINPIAQRELPPTYRSWQFYCTPESVPGVYYYDAEGDADNAVCEYLANRGPVDELSMLADDLKSKWWGYVDDNGLDDGHTLLSKDAQTNGDEKKLTGGRW